MVITRTSIPRRAVLRGMGATLALPLLDAMVPALTLTAKTAASPARRLGVVFVPNGMMMRDWTPATVGAGFEFTPILKPLESFRDQMLVLSGLENHGAWPLPGEGSGDHARSSGAFLTGVHVKKTEGAGLQASTSMDQLAAGELGRETQLLSLELTLESVEFAGACDAGYSCVYTNTISWRTPTTPLPMENDPRAVFERLFGASDSTDPATRLARIEKDNSILDSLAPEMARLQVRLGPRDRAKLTEYFEAVRDVERRIQRAREQSTRELPLVDQPVDIPASYEEHAKLMFDLLALAYQCDLTRVGTFMMAHEVSSRPYPEVGVPDGHHGVSHHENQREKLEKLSKINVFHSQLFAHFLEKLRTTPDGDGSLLDHSIILYGAGMSDPNHHYHDNVPFLVVGGALGKGNGGRHVKFEGKPPTANLYLTLLDRLGVNVEKMGDSTGKLVGLPDV